MKQECSVIVRWRDFTPFKLFDYINSFPRLSDFTGGTPHNDLYEESPREKGTLFRLQAYKRVAEVYERVGKCVI